MAREIIQVAVLDDLPPGRMQYIEVEGLPIALANVRGAIYAFGDSCRHEGGPLSNGFLIDDTVACPWHGWTYSVRTGKALVPPLNIRIPVYPVYIQNGMIYIEVEWPESE